MSMLKKRQLNELPEMQCSNNSNNTNNNTSNNTKNAEHILYCLSMVSVMNISFGDSLYDNYFEGVKAVIGPKQAESIFKQVKDRVEQELEISSSEKSQYKEQDQLINKSILKQIHSMLGKRLDQQIQIKVKLFQKCIDSCIQLTQLPEVASELLKTLRFYEDSENDTNTSSTQMNTPAGKARELIQNICQFIGKEQLIQAIRHSMRKLNIAIDFSQPSTPLTVKTRQFEMCEEIATSSTLSDENSTTLSKNNTEKSSSEASKLPQMLKQTILSRIIPCLAKFQENITHITAFTSTVA